MMFSNWRKANAIVQLDHGSARNTAARVKKGRVFIASAKKTQDIREKDEDRQKGVKWDGLPARDAGKQRHGREN